MINNMPHHEKIKKVGTLGTEPWPRHLQESPKRRHTQIALSGLVLATAQTYKYDQQYAPLQEN